MNKAQAQDKVSLFRRVFPSLAMWLATLIDREHEPVVVSVSVDKLARLLPRGAELKTDLFVMNNLPRNRRGRRALKSLLRRGKARLPKGATP